MIDKAELFRLIQEGTERSIQAAQAIIFNEVKIQSKSIRGAYKYIDDLESDVLMKLVARFEIKKWIEIKEPVYFIRSVLRKSLLNIIKKQETEKKYLEEAKKTQFWVKKAS